MVEFRDELVHALTDFVSDGSDLLKRLVFGVREVPVDISSAGDIRALVAAAHGHHDVGLLSKLVGEKLRLAVGEVNADLSHHLDNLGVNVLGGCGPGGCCGVAAGRGALEQGLTYL